MKLSGSTFVWLAGIGFVWAMGPVRAAGGAGGLLESSRFIAPVKSPTSFAGGVGARCLRRGCSTENAQLAAPIVRPGERRAAGFAPARSPVERVRFGRTPALRRAGAVSFNRFVFRRSARPDPER